MRAEPSYLGYNKANKNHHLLDFEGNLELSNPLPPFFFTKKETKDSELAQISPQISGRTRTLPPESGHNHI